MNFEFLSKLYNNFYDEEIPKEEICKYLKKTFIFLQELENHMKELKY